MFRPGAPEPEPEKEHFITPGVGPPWPCMPGCSCATRHAEPGQTGLPAEDDVGKVMLGSLNWSLAEDLSSYLQGDGPLLERITGKVRASLTLAHAWWVHPDPAAAATVVPENFVTN